MKTKTFFNIALATTMTLTGLFGFSTAGMAYNEPTNTATIQVSPAKGKKIIQTGKKYLGVRYKLGAEYPRTHKFDCSSFTQYVFAKNGIRLSRTARAQYKNGVPVSRNQLRVGDLVFFSTKATKKYKRGSIKKIGHVGIYAGNGKVLHTYGAGGVKFNDMTHGWWDDHYVGAVRVVR